MVNKARVGRLTVVGRARILNGGIATQPIRARALIETHVSSPRDSIHIQDDPFDRLQESPPLKPLSMAVKRKANDLTSSRPKKQRSVKGRILYHKVGEI